MRFNLQSEKIIYALYHHGLHNHYRNHTPQHNHFYNNYEGRRCGGEN